VHDEDILEAFGEIVGLGGGELRAAAGQVRLPLRLGGFGLPSMADTHDAAFYGCAAEVLHDVATRHSGDNCAYWPALGGPAGLRSSRGWVGEAFRVRARLVEKGVVGGGEDEGESGGELPTMDQLAEQPRSGLQASVTRQLLQNTHKLLVREAGRGLTSRDDIRVAEAQRAVARLHSVTGPGAAGWLTALPLTPALTFTPGEFKFACRFRLGLSQPACRDLGGGACVCGQPVDPSGTHLLVCSTGPERTLRHDCLRDTVASCLFSRARIPYQREVLLGHAGVAAGGLQQRMDLVAYPPAGKVQHIDFFVTLATSTSHAAKAAKTPGAAVADGEQDKVRKYGEAVAAAGGELRPFGVEAHGRLGETARRVVAELCRVQVEKTVGGRLGEGEGGGVFGQLVGRAVNRAYQEISCTVQRQNARQVMGRVARIFDSKNGARTAYAQCAFFQDVFAGLGSVNFLGDS
jgi:hypothetical protein